MLCFLQASDPDVGESSKLQYSLLEHCPVLDVDANTGKLYVLDVSGFGDSMFTLQVKATDELGLFTTTTVMVSCFNAILTESCKTEPLMQCIQWSNKLFCACLQIKVRESASDNFVVIPKKPMFKLKKMIPKKWYPCSAWAVWRSDLCPIFPSLKHNKTVFLTNSFQ